MYGLNPLRRARQARGLTLQQVADVTKLSPRVLSRIELGAFEALPPGVLGRAHIRAYAQAVGLDPGEVLRGLVHLLPAEIDPVQALRAKARERFALDHPLAAAVRARAVGWQRAVVALGRTPSRSRPAGPWRRLAGGVIDATILASSAAIAIIASAWITGSDVAGVWRAARLPFLFYSLLMVAVYGLVSHGLGGRTPGVAVIEQLDRALAPRRIGAWLARWQVWG